MKFPNESLEYRDARDYLLQQEVALRREMEEVARIRRRLPLGGKIPEDYVFEEISESGETRKVRMSELFQPGLDSLMIYSYMFGPEKKEPCHMCTPLLQSLNGAARHINQRIPLVIVAESSAERLNAAKTQYGLENHRLISCAGNSYNTAYHGKYASGEDTTFLNVFKRTQDGIFHFWGNEIAEAPMDVGQDHRAVDLLNPIFMAFDFTPEGREDFYTSLKY